MSRISQYMAESDGDPKGQVGRCAECGRFTPVPSHIKMQAHMLLTEKQKNAIRRGVSDYPLMVQRMAFVAYCKKHDIHPWRVHSTPLDSGDVIDKFKNRIIRDETKKEKT